MHENRKKAQPLSLNDLLKMRAALELRIKDMRAVGVMDTTGLEELYERCRNAIASASLGRSDCAPRAGIS